MHITRWLLIALSGSYQRQGSYSHSWPEACVLRSAPHPARHLNNPFLGLITDPEGQHLCIIPSVVITRVTGMVIGNIAPYDLTQGGEGRNKLAEGPLSLDM